MLKQSLLTGLAAFVLTQSLIGGQQFNKTVSVLEEPKALPTWLIDSRVGYTADGDFSDEALGSQDSISYGTSVIYALRLHESLQLKMGGAISGFEFGGSNAPVPTQLQTVGGRFALEYLVQDIPAATLDIRPEFAYAGDDFESDAFTIRVNLATGFQITRSLYGVVGVSYNEFREYQFWPVAGLVWLINDDMRLMLVPPQPHLLVKINDQLDWQIGASFDGGAFKTGDTVDGIPNTELEYTEIRATTGIDYKPTDTLSIRLEAGYAFYRKFNYDSLDEDYRVDPAPYVGAHVKLRF